MGAEENEWKHSIRCRKGVKSFLPLNYMCCAKASRWRAGNRSNKINSMNKVFRNPGKSQRANLDSEQKDQIERKGDFNKSRNENEGEKKNKKFSAALFPHPKIIINFIITDN